MKKYINIDINYYFDDYYINIEFDIKDIYEDLCKYHVDEQKTIKNYEIKYLLNIEKIILKDYIY